MSKRVNVNGNTQGLPRGRQIAREARARRRKIERLYREGYEVAEISRKLKIGRTAIDRHLAQANVPRTHGRTKPMPVWEPGRRPYWELHAWGGSQEIVLGRKFCSGCGRWRHVIDFAHNTRNGQPLPRCQSCTKRASSYYRAHWSDEQRALHREAKRFSEEARRRRKGMQPRDFKNRRTVIDRIERVTVPSEPLRLELMLFKEGDFAELSRRSGVSERLIYAVRHGERAGIRIDAADKLALAIGTTSSLVWGERW